MDKLLQKCVGAMLLYLQQNNIDKIMDKKKQEIWLRTT